MLISPSVLACDFGRMNEHLSEVEPFADRWHIDVMDGVFVPNISYWFPVIRRIKTLLPLDIHLMMTKPDIVIKQLWPEKERLNITHLSTHIELWEDHVREMMQLVRWYGIQYGVVINPPTDISVLKELVHEVDYVLIMSVNPWFGWQSFIAEVLEKAKILRQRNPDIALHIDGGVNAETIQLIKPYNFDLIVSWSYVFKADNPKEAITALK